MWLFPPRNPYIKPTPPPNYEVLSDRKERSWYDSHRSQREYNVAVRGLAKFVKKRDKRVIDMSMKRKEEMERRKEEERERKRKMEKERLERVRAYAEPEWAKVEEQERDDWDEKEEKAVEKEELYCVACGEKFKSEKQWENHEQSKKHREKQVRSKKNGSKGTKSDVTKTKNGSEGTKSDVTKTKNEE
ncbi:DNAJ heat shock N-terminal domain-containing-like protein [Theobroma cacao]|uniref:DNAJ heat shock N-terminal domain-containing-like protein n=1 Tax=Theobroma cacao TaxID=3641 RepID=A0A061FXS0_THECC|nr:DNAJ heat shock N-terminal domain-containing-like protein [Theobroma cacao]